MPPKLMLEISANWIQKDLRQCDLKPLLSKLSRKKGSKLWFKECFVFYWIEDVCLFSRQQRLCLYGSQANILWLFKFPLGTWIFKNFPPQNKGEIWPAHIIIRVWFPRGIGVPPSLSPVRKEVELSEYLRVGAWLK